MSGLPKLNIDALRGKEAYEADLLARPHYHDGTPRKPWGYLGKIEQWSWERLPHEQVRQEATK